MTTDTRPRAQRALKPPRVPISRITAEYHHLEQLPIGEQLKISAKGEHAPEIQILGATVVSGSEVLWDYVLIWREDDSAEH